MIKKIQQLFQHRKTEKTKRELMQSIEKNPKDTRGRLKLGDILTKEGNAAAAAEQYATSAEIFADAGFQLKAIALYKQVLKLEPRSTQALKRAAQLSYNYGLYADAYPYYEALASICATQKGSEAQSKIFLEISALPLRNAKNKLQLLGSIFAEPTDSPPSPFERLLQLGKDLAQDEPSVEDAMILARWLTRFYPDREESRELFASLHPAPGAVPETPQGSRIHPPRAPESGPEARVTAPGPAGPIAEKPRQAEIAQGQVKVKLEANIYDIMKKKAASQESISEASAGNPPGDDRIGFGDLFETFKEGIRGQVSKDDSETHYNLGVAYQEMELFQDAIEEFKLAAANPALQYDAFSVMGKCARDLERLDEALEYYDKALAVGGLSADQVCAARYEQAVTLRLAGKNQEALQVFREIGAKFNDYRDVKEQIDSLL